MFHLLSNRAMQIQAPDRVGVAGGFFHVAVWTMQTHTPAGMHLPVTCSRNIRDARWREDPESNRLLYVHDKKTASIGAFDCKKRAMAHSESTLMWLAK
jgi:hypothetical protein